MHKIYDVELKKLNPKYFNVYNYIYDNSKKIKAKVMITKI